MVSLNKTLKIKNSPADLRKLSEAIDNAYIATGRSGFVKKKSFSPSQFYKSGRCPRFWYYAFNGAEWDGQGDPIGGANRLNGTDAGKRIADILLETEFVDTTEEEVTHDDPPIRGFIDFMAVIDGVTYVGEVKTTRQEAWLHRRTKMDVPAYQLIQLLIYLQVKDERWGLFLIENKNDFSQLFIVVDREEYQDYIDEMFEWMREVYGYALESSEPPKKPYRKNSKECKVCPVRAHCFDDVPGDRVIEPLPDPS